MPRTLISFIGTGSRKQGISDREYRSADYTVNGELVGTSTFIASVLQDYLRADRLILIGTVRSMWEEVYRWFAEENGIDVDETYWYQLAKQTESSSNN